MQLGSSNSIALSDLLGYTRFLANTTDNVSAFTDAQIIALLNIDSRSLQTEILAALNYDWKENTVDGTGSGSVNLTASDNAYAFPTDMLQIDRIELNLSGNSNAWYPATIVPIQSFHRGVTNTEGDAAIIGSSESPVVFIRNKVLYIDPVPKVAVTGGMRIWGQTLVSDLTSASPTGSPVFESAFHEILAYGAAHRWCGSKDKQSKQANLFKERQIKVAQMVNFYSTRVADDQPTIKPYVRSMR